MTRRVLSQQAHGSFSVPELERSRLVLAFPMWPLDLQDDVARRDDVRDVPIWEWLFGLEAPLLAALLDELRQPFEPGAI